MRKTKRRYAQNSCEIAFLQKVRLYMVDDFTDDVINMYRTAKKSPLQELTKRKNSIDLVNYVVRNGFASGD